MGVGNVRQLPELDGQISLPTEAQWERAARGTAGRLFPWDKEAVDLNKANYGFFEKNGIKTTSPVGCYPGGKSFENSMEDLAGNVWEWCLDWYGEKYYADSPEYNPCGPGSGSYRVMRGGSWNYTARSCRAAFRYWYGPDYRYYNLGFRLVLPGQQKTSPGKE
jgi:formylglycine-generating enzyme required for sulfatase activity